MTHLLTFGFWHWYNTNFDDQFECKSGERVAPAFLIYYRCSCFKAENILNHVGVYAVSHKVIYRSFIKELDKSWASLFLKKEAILLVSNGPKQLCFQQPITICSRMDINLHAPIFAILSAHFHKPMWPKLLQLHSWI